MRNDTKVKIGLGAVFVSIVALITLPPSWFVIIPSVVVIGSAWLLVTATAGY